MDIKFSTQDEEIIEKEKEVEEEILNFWKKNKIEEKAREKSRKKGANIFRPRFVSLPHNHAFRILNLPVNDRQGARRAKLPHMAEVERAFQVKRQLAAVTFVLRGKHRAPHGQAGGEEGRQDGKQYYGFC